MEKWKFKEAVTDYEDAVITYRSTNSKKLKYNVCTLNFDNKYIQSKKNRAKETDDTVLLFCWDKVCKIFQNPLMLLCNLFSLLFLFPVYNTKSLSSYLFWLTFLIEKFSYLFPPSWRSIEIHSHLKLVIPL